MSIHLVEATVKMIDVAAEVDDNESINSPYPTDNLGANLAPKDSLNSIPFSKLYTTEHELEYIAQAIASRQIAGDGAFTKKCQHWLQQVLGSQKVLLTHSCTAALRWHVS
jgi:dTDP-4-amino-4,6-dideoxygalactose transaminase